MSSPGREATAELMRHRHESTAHALEMAIRRAYALGRVDQSIGWAAEELRRMVAVDPGITPEEVLRLYGFASPWLTLPGWDEALWRLADIWCGLQPGLQGHPARQPPASPYSVLSHIRAAYEAGREAGERDIKETVLSVFDADAPAREVAATPR